MNATCLSCHSAQYPDLTIHEEQTELLSGSWNKKQTAHEWCSGTAATPQLDLGVVVHIASMLLPNMQVALKHFSQLCTMKMFSKTNTDPQHAIQPIEQRSPQPSNNTLPMADVGVFDRGCCATRPAAQLGGLAAVAAAWSANDGVGRCAAVSYC